MTDSRTCGPRRTTTTKWYQAFFYPLVQQVLCDILLFPFVQVQHVVRLFSIQIHPKATTITATFSTPNGPRIALDLWKKLLLWDREVRHFGDSVEHLLEGQDSRHLSVNTKMLQVFPLLSHCFPSMWFYLAADLHGACIRLFGPHNGLLLRTKRWPGN